MLGGRSLGRRAKTDAVDARTLATMTVAVEDLEADVRLDLWDLWAHDLRGRGTAYRALTAAEMPDARSARRRRAFRMPKPL